MFRVVIDTSVWVAGLRSAAGASNLVLRAARRGRIRTLIGVAMFLEYEAVLKRAEQLLAHGFSPDEIDDLLDAFVRFSEPVDRHFSWRPQLSDPSDEAILEIAVNGRADAIVTHNERDFRPAARFGIDVMTPAVLVQTRKL